MRVHLIAPPARNPFTGGHIFNRRVAGHLAATGDFELRVVPETRIAEALAARDAVCLLDSIYLPLVDPERLCGRPPVLQLVHFLADRDPRQGAPLRPKIDAALRASAGAVVTSEFMRREVRARQENDRVRVCHPGVDAFTENRKSPGGPPRFLTVANFEERKGHRALLACLARLRAIDWRWDIVGDPEADPGYARAFAEDVAAARLGDRITLHGARPEDFVRRLFLEADVFALLSSYEPYGMVFAESVAAGTPVVAFRTGGIPESVDDGSTGLLAHPGDLDAVTANLESLALSPELRARMSRACRRARGRFASWERTAARFMDLVRELAEPEA